jgi:hypothetical protein
LTQGQCGSLPSSRHLPVVRAAYVTHFPFRSATSQPLSRCEHERIHRTLRQQNHLVIKQSATYRALVLTQSNISGEVACAQLFFPPRQHPGRRSLSVTHLIQATSEASYDAPIRFRAPCGMIGWVLQDRQKMVHGYMVLGMLAGIKSNVEPS